MRQAWVHEDDSRERREIEAYIDSLLAKHLSPDLEEPLALPPPPGIDRVGDLEIGTVEYLNQPRFTFKLKLSDLNRHVGIFGSTGSGKTTLASNMIRQLHALGLPFIVFDWETSYRGLKAEFPDVEVFTIGRDDLSPLHLNPLMVPPGIAKDEYAKSVITLMAVDFLSGQGSDSMLLQYFAQAYRQQATPSYRHLKEIVLADLKRDMRGRQMLWKQTVARIIQSLSIGNTASVIDTNKHYPLDQLFGRKIVLEFGAIKNPHERKFLIHLILNWLHLTCAHRGIEHEALKQVLVFEEFHNITLKSQEDNLISNLFREGRKYGLGFIAIDQTPSEIPNAVYANMNVKVSFTLATAQDISSMAKAMNLLPDQRDYLGRLETGQAIVNVKQIGADSFLLRVPNTKRTANWSDLELKEAISGCSDDSHMICGEEPPSSGVQPVQNECISPPSTANGVSDRTFSGLEKCLLADIQNHQFDGIRERLKRLGLHPSQLKDLSDSLIQAGILRPVLVDGLKLFEITEHGKMRLEEAGLFVPRKRTKPGMGKGRGGLEHAYVVRALRDHLIASGLVDTRTEVDDIDITAKPVIAIEVETGKAQPYRSMKKLLQSGCDEKYLIATRKEVALSLERVTSSIPGLKVMHFKEFIKSYSPP